MCGIVSAVSSTRDVVPILIQGLKHLEYRGYDSAGLAVINGALRRVRSLGRVAALEARVADDNLAGDIGIAHTRWATHGAPSERNAHPHVSGGVSIVHNGIIENHAETRIRLRAIGYEFLSETDSEVIVHLIHSKLSAASTLLAAVRQALAELRGAYAIAVISADYPGHLVVARNGAPLLLGLGKRENFAASDAAALLAVTRRVIYLQDGDCADITLTGVRITDEHGSPVQRPISLTTQGAAVVGLGRYQHYMQKEIFEQPAAVANTLAAIIAEGTLSPAVFGNCAQLVLHATDAILILACGTSYHAAMVARYWIESLAGMPCIVEIASEYRYRDPVPHPNTLVIAISQSGETADTLAAMRYATSRVHLASMSICNVRESSLARATDLGFLTQAGPEIGVASTKAFTTQLVALSVLAMMIAKQRGRLSCEREQQLLHELATLPDTLERSLALEPQIECWADQLHTADHALFLGRGAHYPIAMEGALKLKEISYIHAEAYAAGELKHGALALVSVDMPVIAVVPRDSLIDKLKSNLEEVRTRGGEMYVLAADNAGIDDNEGIRVIRVPACSSVLSPIAYSIPLQLLAYHAAVRRGNDVDKPRNLAKSVTVE